MSVRRPFDAVQDARPLRVQCALHLRSDPARRDTLFQKDADGKQMVDLITGNGMIPGIKLDKGYDKAGLPGTATGPLGHAETWCKGIDDLETLR